MQGRDDRGANVENNMVLLPRHLQSLLVSSSAFLPQQCVPDEHRDLRA